MASLDIVALDVPIILAYFWPSTFVTFYVPPIPFYLGDGSLNTRNTKSANREDRKTTNATRIDPNDDLRDYNTAVAMWLSRYSYDNYAECDDVFVVPSSNSPSSSSSSTTGASPLPSAPQALALSLGPIRISLGISVPIVWLANMACDFRGACERRTADFYDDDDDDNEEVAEYKQRIEERVPMRFDSKEQLRFKVLQLAYTKARRGNDVDVAEEESVLVLSPRMIVTSRACRRTMRDTLVRYLETNIASLNMESPHPACRPRPRDAQDGDVIGGGHSTTLRTSMVASTSTSITTTTTVTETTTTRGAGKKNAKAKGGKKKKGKKRQQQQQHGRPMSEATIRSTAPYDVRHQCEAKGRDIGDYGEGGQGHEHEQHVEGNNTDGVYTWCCDYCRVAMFPTYQMATDHERTCPVYLKMKEKEELEFILNDICATNSETASNATRGGRGGGGGMNTNTRKGKTNSKKNEYEDNMTMTRAGEGVDKSGDKSLSIIDDDRGSTSDSADSSSSSSSPSTTITRDDGGHSPNEPQESVQIEDDDEEEWTHLPPKQTRKKSYLSLGVVMAKVAGGKCNDGNQTYAASPLDDLPTVTPARTIAPTTGEYNVSSNGKENSVRSRNKSNIPDVTPAFLARAITAPALSAKYGRALSVASPASTKDDVKMTTTEEKVSDQLPHNIITTSQTERNIAQKKLPVMKSSTIDYDDRVNDTALPQPDHDDDQSSTYMDKPMASIISTLSQKSYATAVSTAAVAEAAASPADDVTTSSLLLRVSSLTSENEMLTARNHLLLKHNEALLGKLAEAKRQSIEAVQHVHLKAYIAETARSAAEDRASRLESILLGLASDITFDELVRREIQDAISGNSSLHMSPVQSINIDTATRTRGRVSAGSASMTQDAPSEYFPHSSATDGTTNPSPPRFERILSRLRRGDHAFQMS